MKMTRTEQLEFSRAAQAMYTRGHNDLGHLLSGTAASSEVPSEQYDRAAAAYRAWLVFDEPKEAPTFAEMVQIVKHQPTR